MRVHLAGTRSFGVAVLDAILERGHTVTGVTAPAGDPVYAAAVGHRVPWSDRIGPDVVAGADVIVSAHSHAFVGRRTRAAVEHAIGYHPSLLPLHRGRDAVRWTIRDRDRVAGGSVYHLTDVVDGGPIAAHDWCFVRPGDTARTLWRRDLSPMGVRLLVGVLADLDRGRVVCVPQDAAVATWEPAMDAPPLHRPELIELPGRATRWEYDADPAAARAAR